MTVDSVYIPELTPIEPDDLEVAFEIESVGAEAFKVFYVDTASNVYSLLPEYAP